MNGAKYDLSYLKAAIDRMTKDKATSIKIQILPPADKLHLSYTNWSSQQVIITIPPQDGHLFAEITITDTFSVSE